MVVVVLGCLWLFSVVLVVLSCLWLFLVVVTFDLLLQVVVIAVKPHLYTEVLHKLAGEGRRWKLFLLQNQITCLNATSSSKSYISKI